MSSPMGKIKDGARTRDANEGMKNEKMNFHPEENFQPEHRKNEKEIYYAVRLKYRLRNLFPHGEDKRWGQDAKRE